MVWHGSAYIVPQNRSFPGTLYFFGQVDSVPRGLAVHDIGLQCTYWGRNLKNTINSLETISVCQERLAIGRI